MSDIGSENVHPDIPEKGIVNKLKIFIAKRRGLSTPDKSTSTTINSSEQKQDLKDLKPLVTPTTPEDSYNTASPEEIINAFKDRHPADKVILGHSPISLQTPTYNVAEGAYDDELGQKTPDALRNKANLRAAAANKDIRDNLGGGTTNLRERLQPKQPSTT